MTNSPNSKVPVGELRQGGKLAPDAPNEEVAAIP